ncbi:Eco57I restriction-modification methylase domain-containing protein [Prevotella melaninogenica]|uniref:Eco57I restriction-modification methylase domain-containing protein n=3 Tax=Prevotella melaninogenica TaxID=28132 RepID=UPI001C5F34D4|nr:Eco57I restriction-modification methylase domain-containing protein [Prevotella melaninogenica]MBW4750787.1 Eco57I restriction-modification methylase domain-containing protein [Prevotella melaninogenica]
MNYKEIIESKYNRESWQQLLHDIFLNKVTFHNSPGKVHVSNHLAKEALNLGYIKLSDGLTIAIYEVELSDNVDIERNRRGIRDMLTTDWRTNHAGAFMFCYRKNESILRFSYVSETWGFNKQGEYEKISTDTKRYTYLLGEGRGCHTAIKQFGKLKESKQALTDITEAFSVETLTKQFYKDLFEWYQWAIDDSTQVTFPNNITKEDDDRDDVEKKVIRMITRIMFVWFIKQKELVPNRIFDIEYLSTILKEFDPYSTTVGNYYNAILQNLFFATLNCAIEDENGNTRKFATSTKRDVKTLYRYAEMFSISEQEIVNLFSEVPFLNGGLFECLDKTRYIDGVEQCYNFDGFSRNDARFADGRYKHRAVVPNILFFEPEKGLLSILSRYNFTIEENSPEEQQVALDPELLGKVFENLLGAYNPETKETARNQSGSFYTPREIVNYMVDESLIAYLGNNDFVRSLFSYDFTFDKTKSNEYLKIADKLKAVKILDPACGSGAFPMGLLNRMIDILERISPNEDIYELKLSVIENCLYGCDIQSIAAQITKLRFFISLICNCEKDASKPNFGIPTLPNLETNFVSANSLIAKKKEDRQLNLFKSEEIESIKKELHQIRHLHFSAKSTSTKHRLREKDLALREELIELLSDENNFASDDAKQLAEWNPYDQNDTSSFFDPEWMFGVADGFDIVIGNPPYIQLQNNGGELAKLYEGCGYSTFARTGDIYCLFYERGWQLLKKDGHLCYITSNKWMRAGYGEKTRDFFANKTNPLLLIDFAGVKIFESATVDTNILLFSRSNNQHKTTCAITNKQNKDSVKNLSDFVQQQHTVCDFSTSDSWVILSPIEQSIKRKIEAVGTPLKDWDINIYRGVLTGCNEAFIISTVKRNEILANCQTEEERKRTDELIRPILRGRDIRRYGYVDNGLYLINTHNGIKGKLPRIDINDYPAVKAHLDQYWDKISVRSDKGDTPYNLRNCAYLEDFSKPKIVYMEIQTDNEKEGYPFPCFSYDNSNKIVLNTAYIISSNTEDVRFILGVINSKMGRFLTKLYVSQLQERQFRMLAQYVKNFPIPKLPQNEIDYIIKAVENNINKCNSELEEKINRAVCSWYNLNADELNFIEQGAF